MRKRILLFSLLLLSLSIWNGCAISSAIPLNPAAKYTPVNTNEVIIYLEDSDLPEHYEKVGVILTDGWQPAKRMEKARREAAKMGANGLYWENYNVSNNYINTNGDTLVVNQNPHYGSHRLIAIRVE